MRILCVFLFFGCLSFSHSLHASSACLSMQGNGERYPALIAQVLALLERDIEPRVILGGSSAAGASTLVRGLLENPSIENTPVWAGAKLLSRAEKAARILATFTGPGGSLVVLPSVNELGSTLSNFIKFVYADTVSEAFIGLRTQKLAPIEAATGQIVLLSEFYATHDFSEALLIEDLKSRERLVFNEWVGFANMIQLSPKEFINALITPKSSDKWNEKVEQIKKRYFYLFYNDEAKKNPIVALDEYNENLEKISFILAKIPEETWERVWLEFIKNFEGIPFVSSTASLLSRDFYLPDGEKVIDTYLGNGALKKIPSGTLIHTTARVAKKERLLPWLEKEGLEYFYQTYLPSEDIYQDILERKLNLSPSDSFLSYLDENQEPKKLLDAKNLLVLDKSGDLSTAIKLSSAEPNSFRRDFISLSNKDIEFNSLSLASNERLVTFGGWLEHASTSTISRLEACQDVDFIIEISNLSEGLFSFQRKAIRAVIAGAKELVFSPMRKNTEKLIQSNLFIENLEKTFITSRSSAGKQRYFRLDYDWDNASGLQGELADQLNARYDSNRDAFFIAAYQDAYKKLDKDSRFNPDSFSAIGADLNAISLSEIDDPEELDASVSQILGN